MICTKQEVGNSQQLLGLCDALDAKLEAAQVERERLEEMVVAGIAAGGYANTGVVAPRPRSVIVRHCRPWQCDKSR
jgi:hypothetical protein